jgi:hypothetical protein
LFVGILFLVTLWAQAGFRHVTVAVHGPIALRTDVSAGIAAGQAGDLISFQALAAIGVLAYVAGGHAVGAEVLLTSLTRFQIVFVGEAITVGTTPAIPVLDRHVWRRRVVCLENRADQTESVVDSAMFQLQWLVHARLCHRARRTGRSALL